VNSKRTVLCCLHPFIKNPHEGPKPVRNHTAVVYGKDIVIFGGKNDTSYFNSLYILYTGWKFNCNLFVTV